VPFIKSFLIDFKKMTNDKDENTVVKNFRNVQDVGDRTITFYTSLDSAASSIFGISTVFAFALLQLV